MPRGPICQGHRSPLARQEASAAHDIVPSDKRAAIIRPGVTPLKPSVAERLPLCISGGLIHGRGVVSKTSAGMGLAATRAVRAENSKDLVYILLVPVFLRSDGESIVEWSLG